jgi:hypothetical protein
MVIDVFQYRAVEDGIPYQALIFSIFAPFLPEGLSKNKGSLINLESTWTGYNMSRYRFFIEG